MHDIYFVMLSRMTDEVARLEAFREQLLSLLDLGARICRLRCHHRDDVDGCRCDGENVKCDRNRMRMMMYRVTHAR